MELTGRIIRVFPVKSGVSKTSGEAWKRLDAIFGFYESPSDIYERTILLSFLNERADSMSYLTEGMSVKVRVRLSCYERPQGSGNWFNDIRVGDVTLIGEKQPQQQSQTGNVMGGPQTPPYKASEDETENENGKLPF